MSSRLGILCNTMEYPLEICLSYVFVIVFFSCSEVSGRVSGKVSVLDVFFLPWSARSSHFKRSVPPKRTTNISSRLGILCNTMEYPLEICLSYVFVIVFFSCSEVSGRVSGKVSVLDVFFCLGQPGPLIL